MNLTNWAERLLNLNAKDYYQSLDFPKIPIELLITDPAEVRRTLPNIFGGESKNYTIHECPDELTSYLKTIFPYMSKFRYQTLRNDIPVHVDIGRRFAVNYIITPGGKKVNTVWYKEDCTTEVFRVKLQSNTWYRLEVDKHHTVSGLTDDRLAITIC
jgi:hypothetical protein|tara:strand:+ start:45 stop:515 length:471 start_codon:yes stop_codon:yes gene_type:complete